jgi:hypothetical protein
MDAAQSPAMLAGGPGSQSDALARRADASNPDAGALAHRPIEEIRVAQR